MKTLSAALAMLALLLSAAPARAQNVGDNGSAGVGKDSVSTGLGTAGPASADSSKPPTPASTPVVSYVTYELTQDRPANNGDLNGLCFVDGDSTKPGFQYELVGTTADGVIVDQRPICVAFTEPGVKPPPPALPQPPTFDEIWKSAQLPQPVVVTDPATRGITGLETRISTIGEKTKAVVVDLRGYHLVAAAHLDHYTISVDGGRPVVADHDRYMFETKGNHTITIAAVWKGEATLTGPDLIAPIHINDIGTATLTTTRTYPVHEVRSVLQP